MFFNINSGKINPIAKIVVENRRSKYHWSDKRLPLFTLNALDTTRLYQNKHETTETYTTSTILFTGQSFH